MTDLATIFLNHNSNNISNFINGFFGDPRTWTLVAAQGFFTGLGVLIATLLGDSFLFRFLKGENKKQDLEIKTIKEEIKLLWQKK